MKTLGILALFLFLGACQDTYYIKGEPMMTGEEIEVLTADISRTQFSDLPVPASFVLQNNNLESYASQVGNFRMGKLIYHGSNTPEDVVEYLEKRMPEHGWTLSRKNTSDKNATSLIFSKAQTRSTYKIERETVKSNQSGSAPEVFTKLQIDIQTGKTE